MALNQPTWIVTGPVIEMPDWLQIPVILASAKGSGGIFSSCGPRPGLSFFQDPGSRFTGKLVRF